MSSEGDRSRDPEELEPEMEATVTLLHAVETPDFYDTYAIVQVLADNHNLTRMVVEGIEDGEKYYVLRYRLVPGDKAEKIKNYYATFEQFSKGIFAPSDLLRLWKTSTHQLKPESGESSDNRSQEHAAEEFVAFFEWGEPDYIDLPRLTNMQAIKFLRSLVEILETTADMTRLTHGDICLENIILVGAQLKLSGWKPFFFAAAEDESSLD